MCVFPDKGQQHVMKASSSADNVEPQYVQYLYDVCLTDERVHDAVNSKGKWQMAGYESQSTNYQPLENYTLVSDIYDLSTRATQRIK